MTRTISGRGDGAGFAGMKARAAGAARCGSRGPSGSHRPGRRSLKMQSRNSRYRGRQDAGVQRPADHDRGARGDAFREQVLERRLFDKAIAPREQKRVPGTPFQRFDQYLALVDADADGCTTPTLRRLSNAR